MKIIVMCLPRTGSTSLRRYIQSVNVDYNVYNEPFNPQIEQRLTWPIFSYKDIIHYDNLFIKSMSWHIPKDLKHLSIEEFYEKLLKDFDKVVFLNRLNIDDLCISLATAQLSNNWHKPYGKNIVSIDAEYLHNTISYILDKKEQMLQLSNTFNIPIYHYETLYSNKEIMKNFIENTIGLNFNDVEYDLYLNNEKKYIVQVKSLI